MTRKFLIKVTQRTARNGNVFNSYKTATKNNRLIDVKFKKAVKNLPEKDCYINVPEEKAELNTSGIYPVLWIGEVESIESLEEALKETNKKKLADFFGE